MTQLGSLTLGRPFWSPKISINRRIILSNLEVLCAKKLEFILLVDFGQFIKDTENRDTSKALIREGIPLK